MFPFDVGDTDLRSNIFEEEGSDAPRIGDPGQDGANLDRNDVTSSDPADRDIHRIDPQTSGMELRLDPRPDDGTDRPT